MLARVGRRDAARHDSDRGGSTPAASFFGFTGGLPDARSFVIAVAVAVAVTLTVAIAAIVAVAVTLTVAIAAIVAVAAGCPPRSHCPFVSCCVDAERETGDNDDTGRRQVRAKLGGNSQPVAGRRPRAHDGDAR